MNNSTITTSDLRGAIDLYWLAMVHVRNILEDVEGSDGRLGYLEGLRYKLIVVAAEMDAIITGRTKIDSSRERYAAALSVGLPGFGWTEANLADLAGFGPAETQTDYTTLKNALVSFCNAIIDHLPGDLPNAQGVEAQRNMLTAMQRWQVIADNRGEDLAFLEKRLMEL
jgi:hypothetical protein